MNLDGQDNPLSSHLSDEQLWIEVDTELARLEEAAGVFDQAAADSLGLSRSDLQCLGVVLRRGRVTAGELADACSLTTGSVTALLDRMEKTGYLRRSADPADRRRVLVEATPMAAERVQALLAPLTAATRARLEGASIADLGTVRDYLRAGADARAEQAAAIRARLSGASAANELASPLAALQAGRLLFNAGTSVVRIAANRDMPDLYRVRFEGAPPQIESNDGVVAIRHKRGALLPFRKSSVTEVVLNGSIPWSIEVRGGTSMVTAELADVRLESLTVTGGASMLDLTLGGPTGVVAVRISGGASEFTVHRPRGTPMRLRMRGSMSWAIVDGAPAAATAGSAWLDYPGDEGSGRYDIEVSGAASMLRVDVS